MTTGPKAGDVLNTGTKTIAFDNILSGPYMVDIKGTLNGVVVSGSSNGWFYYATDSAITCSETDNGKDYFKKGTTSFNGAKYGSGSMTDFCNASNNINEMYCIGNAGYGIAVYACPNGCQDGACKL